RHAGCKRKLPEIFAAATDTDLDGAVGIQDAGKHCLAEWRTMVKFRSFIRPSRVTMRIDMYHSDRLPVRQSFEDGTGDRVISSNRQRDCFRSGDHAVASLDVGMALRQV